MPATVLLVAAALAAGQAPADAAPPGVQRSSDSTLVYDGAAGQIDIATPRLAGADIDVDGRLSEPEWESAAVLQNFTQYDPVEGIPASQPTEARVFVTDDAIYVAIRASAEPGQIRASITERDEIVRRDDYVQIILDTFNDHRRGFVFVVNPYGIQQDGVWFEGGGGGGGGRGRGGGGGGGGGFFGQPVDYNPDLIWESHGEIDDTGYTVEVRIPFKSIRFARAEVQTWGFQLVRHMESNGYKSSWAPISRNMNNQLSQAGSLQSLEGLDPGLFLEFNPVATSSITGTYDEDLDALHRAKREDDFGLNLTYGLTSNLTLDATVNPDFSQVEADAGQIAVNERFALFFQEKRPFFLQGTEIFGMPQQLVYTRTVANPIVGTKITGKIGDFGVGYLGAIDEVAGADNAIVNLLRLRRDVGSGSNVGLLYTDRTQSTDLFNRVIAGDARLLLGPRYSLTVLGGLSFNGVEAAGSRRGNILTTRFERSGRGFTANAEFENYSPNFHAGSGFIRRVAVTNANSRLSYNWYGGRGALVERWGPAFQTRITWDHDDFWGGHGPQETEVELSLTASFRGNVTFWGNVFYDVFDFESTLYDGLFRRGTADGLHPFVADQSQFSGMTGVRAFTFFNTWQRVRGRISGEMREQPIFDRRRGVPVEVADSWGTDVNLTIFPTNSWLIEVGARHQSLQRKSGEPYSSATIPRLRTQYQISRSLFFRLIGEYASQETNGLVAPDGTLLESCVGGTCTAIGPTDTNDIYFETLLSYEPTPGTVFFIGYSREMEEPVAFDFRNVQAQRDGFFVKASYRFRY